jgi:succinate-semialdehyde dehydrogenase/glutarate-semialdehyde dehydrogenase
MPFTSRDPATGALLRDLAPTPLPAAEAALLAVAAAAEAWARAPVDRRLGALSAIAAALDAGREPLARAVVREVGKPLTQARAEVDKCADLARVLIDLAPGALAPRYVRLDGVDAWIEPAPLGVVLAVMPANYPLWQPLRTILPQLAVGNGVLLKPAPTASLCADALLDALHAAHPDLPLGLARVDEASTLALIAHPRVRAAVCVGGLRAGAAVGAACGAARKRSVLELGGNDAYVILADADLPAAAAEVVRSRFKNAGQACLSAKRVIVEAAVWDAFIAEVRPRVAAARLGDPMDPATQVGPLASAEAVERLQAEVDATVAAGAACLLGGRPADLPGFYYHPTLLVGVPPDSAAFTDELFGPVVALTPARDADEAIALANQSRFGLGAAVFTGDRARGLRLAREGLRAGTVALNGPATSDPRLPFGGLGDSGHGVELGVEGLLELTARRVLRAPRAPLRMDRMDHPFVHPAPVIDALRASDEADLSDHGDPDALRAALAEALGLPAVALTHGAEDALLKLLLLQAADGRKVVLLPTPTWEGLPRLVSSLGLLAIPVPHLPGPDGYRTDTAALDATLARSPRATLLLASPNNPTGHQTDAAWLAALPDRHPQARLVLDGVWTPLRSPLAPLAAAHPGRVWVVGSFSSQLGLPGLRLGWIAGRLPGVMGAAPGLGAAALRTAAAALAHRARTEADLDRARGAAAALGRSRGRRWTGVPTEAPFVLTTLAADVRPDELDAAEAAAGVRPARLRLPEGLALRWTPGPASADARVRAFLDRLDAAR